MKTAPDCLPCLLRQALEAARLASDDTARHERMVQQTLGVLAAFDPAQPPPAAAQTIQRLLRRATGDPDPYRDAKRRFTALAWELLPRLEKAARQSADPSDASVRLAIAGNVLDLGAKGGLGETAARDALLRGLEGPLAGDPGELQQAASLAGRILYLADNAGELVIDRLLLARLPPGRVTVAVRSAPVFNDATRAEAAASGIADLAEVIDTGSDAPGTLLEDCSPEFRRRFRAADLLIAKGQGNFECLADRAPGAFFLFRVKCPAVAAQVGRPVGTAMLWRAPAGGGPHPRARARAADSNEHLLTSRSS